jgi:hypothetical protein
MQFYLIEKAMKTGYMIEETGKPGGYPKDVQLKSKDGKHLGCGDIMLVRKRLYNFIFFTFQFNIICRLAAVVKIQ